MMKIFVLLAILGFLGGALSFAPVHSMTIRPSKLYSIEPAAGVEEVEEMYLEVEYEGFFDGTKVCALSAIVIII
jgi:hypothetical protein